MSFLEMPDSIMPIEPTPEERVIANMTDQQISDIAIEALKLNQKNHSYMGNLNEAYIKDYASTVVVFNGYRKKAQEKVQAFEKMVTAASKHVEPSMSVETSIKPEYNYSNIKTVNEYSKKSVDNSLYTDMYDDYHSIDRGPVR